MKTIDPIKTKTTISNKFLEGAYAVLRPLRRVPDPLAVFARLTDNGRRPRTVLLESAEPSSRKTQKSLLVVSSALSIECRGADVALSALNAQGKTLLPALEAHFERFSPRSEGNVLRLRVPVRNVENTSASDETCLPADSSLTVLRELAALFSSVLPSTPEAVLLAGIFAYDLVDQFEPMPETAEVNDFPDYLYYLADQIVVIDHLTSSGYMAVCAFDGRGQEETEAALAEMEKAISPSEETLPEETLPADPEFQRGGSMTLHEIKTDIDDAAFAAQVEVLKEHIISGELSQIVMSRTFSAPCADSFEAYRVLRTINPSPYLFYMRHDDFALFGASPESSVKVDGATRSVEISPIAGTRHRGLRDDGSLDVDLDSLMEAELRLDKKENAEHMMLVDLALDDVARVSKPGTCHVADLLRVERYSHVMHLVSRVRGELRNDLDALHAYQACMNMGTLTGAPKVRAMQLLRSYETGRRGHYGGAIGYLRGDGSFDTAIVIRAALVQNGVAHIRAGAGIVSDSVPASEADETRHKAEAVLRAIVPVERSAGKHTAISGNSVGSGDVQSARNGKGMR